MGGCCTRSSGAVSQHADDSQQHGPDLTGPTIDEHNESTKHTPDRAAGGGGGAIVRVAPRIVPLDEFVDAATSAAGTDAAAGSDMSPTTVDAPTTAGPSPLISSDDKCDTEPVTPLLLAPQLPLRKPIERERRASSSGGGLQHSKLVEPSPTQLQRRVSRPSTPRSRTERVPPSPSQTNNCLQVPRTPPHQPPLSDPLGWAVAPNAPAFDPRSSTLLSPRSATAIARRRTGNTIPDTIHERLGREPRSARSRRATGGPLERTWNSDTVAAPDATRHGVANAHVAEEDESHSRETSLAAGSSSPSIFGGSSVLNEEGARHELTNAQERELRMKPHLWTDPRIYTHHIDAVFSYYSTLPIISSPISLNRATAVRPSSSSASSLPSIHHADRIVYPQLQRLARDCVHRVFLMCRREVQQSHPDMLDDDALLDRKTWSTLEPLLPGHGHEAQTHHYASLYLLSALAKTKPGSVGRREFTLLWPAAHRALFSLPSEHGQTGSNASIFPDQARRERQKLISSCYKLRLDELLEPSVSSPTTTQLGLSSSPAGPSEFQLSLVAPMSPSSRNRTIKSPRSSGGSARRRTGDTSKGMQAAAASAEAFPMSERRDGMHQLPLIPSGGDASEASSRRSSMAASVAACEQPTLTTVDAFVPSRPPSAEVTRASRRASMRLSNRRRSRSPSL